MDRISLSDSLRSLSSGTISSHSPSGHRTERSQLQASSQQSGPSPAAVSEIVHNVALHERDTVLHRIVEDITYAQLPKRTTSQLVVVVFSGNEIFFVKKLRQDFPFLSANRFLQEKGFEVARIQIFPSDIQSAQIMSERLTSAMSSEPQNERLSDQQRWNETFRRRWDNEFQTHPYVLISSKVPGIPFNLLTPDRLRLVMKDASFCSQLGKMVFFDALLGNRDRLNEELCNGGNFLVEEKADQSFNLGLIDHEIDLSQGRATRYRERLSRYLSGHDMKTTVGKLLAVHSLSLNRWRQRRIQQRMQNGFNQAVADFIRDYPRINDFSSCLINLGYNGDDDVLEVIRDRYQLIYASRRSTHGS